MSTKKEILAKYRITREKYKDDPETLGRLQTLVKREIEKLENTDQLFDEIGAGEKYNYEEAAAELDQIGNEPFLESGIRTNPVLPRFSATGNLGDMALDIGSGIGRGGLALMEGGIAKGAELYTGGDLPVGEIMLESLMRTGGAKDQGGLESFAEDVLRDPTLLVPGLGQAKIVKNIGSGVGRLGVLAAQEGALEATSQLLDSDREMDVANIVLGGSVPIVGKGMKQLGKGLSKLRYGERGADILEGELLPIGGSPIKKIDSELTRLSDKRTSELSDYDDRMKRHLDDVQNYRLLAGADAVDVSDARYRLETKDLDLAKQNSIDEVNRIEMSGLLKKDEADKLRESISQELDEFKEFGNLMQPLNVRSNRWLAQSRKKVKPGNVDIEQMKSDILYKKTQPILQKPGGVSSKEIVNLQDLKDSKIKESDLTQMGSVGSLKELISIPPIIRSVYDGGSIMQSDRTRLAPELITNIFDEINKEKED